MMCFEAWPVVKRQRRRTPDTYPRNNEDRQSVAFPGLAHIPLGHSESSAAVSNGYLRVYFENEYLVCSLSPLFLAQASLSTHPLSTSRFQKYL